jgi:hypothetical protein
MPSIEIRPGTRIEIEEILTGVSNLNAEELEKFVEKVLALRAKRISPSLSKEETTLLKMINRGLPAARRKRFVALSDKRATDSLSDDEYQELLDLTEELEQLNAERIQYLSQLASLRGVGVRELMKELGIHPKPLHG